MGKTRVGVVLRESLGTTKSHNESQDLRTLNGKYIVWCKRIKHLIQSLQAHHAAMAHIDKSRLQVTGALAGMTKSTPLWESCGIMPSADRPSDTVHSYAAVHDNLSAKAKSYVEKFQQHVLEYAVEWEKTVRTRIDNGLKKAEELRRDLDHYQKKTEALRLSTNQAKGKNVKNEAAEKLKRNEEKLLAAKQNYNRVATDLCILMEEVTERSWRDLHPLLLKVAQFDMTLSGDESKILAGLNSMVSDLKQVATQHGISPQPRLKDLGALKPELLSTRPGGVAGYMALENGTGSAALTTGSSPLGGSMSLGSGGGGGGSSGFAFDPMAQPPGTVGAQGMGGFPVQVNNSSSNNYDPTSTMGMLTISQASAPAPTLDDVYGSTSVTRSAPTTGNLPPLGPSGYNSAMASPSYGNNASNYPPRSQSFTDNDSVSAYSGFSGYSNYSAPPMGAPPPPPSMPPPPPPSYATPSTYSGYGAPVAAAPPYGAPSYGGAAPPAYGAPPPPMPPPQPYGAGPTSMDPYASASSMHSSGWNHAMPPSGSGSAYSHSSYGQPTAPNPYG